MEVAKAFSAIARPENVPAVSPSWNARAVAMPWLASPIPKPRAAGSWMRSALSRKGATTAPLMP